MAALLTLSVAGCINVVDKQSPQSGPVSDDRRMADEDNIPVHGQTPGRTCTTDGLSGFIGQRATEAMGADILRVSNAARLRWIRPGDAVTADYREDRVNVNISNALVITGFGCG